MFKSMTLALGGWSWITASISWTGSHDVKSDTMALANTPVATLPTGTALVRTNHVWEQVGAVAMHGELPG